MQRKHFEHIEVIAGHKGLERFVKWIHIVDVVNIRNLLNGNELILSTGVAWKNSKELFLSFVEQLIEADTAGLCVELGSDQKNIPSEVINRANQYNFPIILLHKVVPFVEITQDIHTFLINNQYNMLSALESYSQRLNKKLLSIKSYDEILFIISQYLRVQTVITFQQDTQFIPKKSESEQKKILSTLQQQSRSSPCVTTLSIPLLGDQYAELTILASERVLTEFDQLILDRTVTALAQFFLRELYVEEKRRAEETEWLIKWIKGEHTIEAIQEYLTPQPLGHYVNGGVVCYCTLNPLERYSDIEITYFKLYFRTVFEQHGFVVFTTRKKQILTFILMNTRSSATWHSRLKEATEKLEVSKEKPSFTMGVGKFVESVENIHHSYQSAVETLRMKRESEHHRKSYFYDELHIHRIISALNRSMNLNEMIHEYLGPILSYDKKYNGKLMETLKVYLACRGSKQESAKKLYIVRQTLYHRIEKLENLLGKDFMKDEKRLAIEFMVHAYDFLSSSKQMKSSKMDIRDYLLM